MREALPGLGVEARFGVNTGEVVTSADDTLVTGDAVNVAARLQQAATPGEILVGTETRLLAGSAVEADELEPLKLKGKAEPVPAFRLLSVGNAPERAHGSRFVGRADELAFLRAAWGRAVREGRCELLTIVGEPGVGKSRLVAEFAAGLNARVVVGGCLSYGEGITYLPVIGVVKQLDVVADDSAVAGAIGSLLGATDAATSPEEIAWGFRKLLERAAPLVVVFDDIQWGEEAFLDLVEQVPLLSSGASLLLVCLARPELTARRPEWPLSLRLEPLSPPDVNALVPVEFAAGLRERIVRAAGGNPLFATEMVAMTSVGGEEIVVPPTLKALLAARLDQLEEGERVVLERGALEGELFHRGAVQALAPAERQVSSRLAALVRKALIRPERPLLALEDGFRFCHLLIRDAAYDGLPKATRAELHERFAGWLDEHAIELVELDEIVGYHLEQSYRYRVELADPETETGPLGERAAARLIDAGRRAADRADFRAVANLLRRALALEIADSRERLRVQVELAFVLSETGQRPEARALLAASLETATAFGAQDVAATARVLASRMQVFYAEVEPEDFRIVAQEAIETFTVADDEHGLSRAWVLLARVEMRRGQLMECLSAYEHALEHAVAAGDQTLRREAITGIAYMLVRGPVPVPDAIRRCEELIDSNSGDRALGAVVARSLAELVAMDGRLDEARDLLERSGPILAELGQANLSTTSRYLAAAALDLCGDRAGAEHELETSWRALAAQRSDGKPQAAAMLHVHRLALLYCDEGRWQEAERCLEYGQEIPMPVSFRVEAVLGLAARARVAAHRGDLNEALSLARRGVELAGESDGLEWQAQLRLALAEVLRVGGEQAEADAALQTAVQMWDRKGNLAAAARLRAAESARAG
jgi:tetratricopeptide (TPR) repeat protein